MFCAAANVSVSSSLRADFSASTFSSNLFMIFCGMVFFSTFPTHYTQRALNKSKMEELFERICSAEQLSAWRRNIFFLSILFANNKAAPGNRADESIFVSRVDLFAKVQDVRVDTF